MALYGAFFRGLTRDALCGMDLMRDWALMEGMMLVSDMWDDDDDERYCHENCHHCYGWSSNCRCLNCGKQMDTDPDEDDKYEY